MHGVGSICADCLHMINATKNAILATFGLAVCVLTANAGPIAVTYEGNTYEVSIVSGNNATLTQLESQVWWGEQSTALYFGNAVGMSLGNMGAISAWGLLFAYQTINNSGSPGIL